VRRPCHHVLRAHLTDGCKRLTTMPQPCCPCNSTYTLWCWRSRPHMLWSVTDVRRPHASTVLIFLLNWRHGVCLFKWYGYALVLTCFNVERSLRQQMMWRAFATWETTMPRHLLLLILLLLQQYLHPSTMRAHVTGCYVNVRRPRHDNCVFKPCCYCNSTYTLWWLEHMWKAVAYVRRPCHN
jgi:hypothetical protein